MTSLAQYDKARAALAEATRIDEILPLRDEVEHLKLHAKQIRDRTLLAEAHAFQMRVERKLGTVIKAAKEAGQISEGRRRKPENCTGEEQFPRVTLDEVGIDRKLSARAQKAAEFDPEAFERVVDGVRARILAGSAKLIDGDTVNGARAIMGSRVEPDDSLDYFPTPPFGTRALLEIVLPSLCFKPHSLKRVREPACGEGHIAGVLQEYAEEVIATDIHDYSADGCAPPAWAGVADYLAAPMDPVDWIITNPPFEDKGEAFVVKALAEAQVGVAMFMRMQWLETIGRYERIFRDTPPTRIAFFSERVPICKGRWDPTGGTATAYIWLVWLKGRQPMAPIWIPPSRDRLTRDDDVARFTAHPVRAFERIDPETGEVLGPQIPEISPAPPPAAREMPSLPAGGGDPLDIPDFLRRKRPGEQAA